MFLNNELDEKRPGLEGLERIAELADAAAVSLDTTEFFAAFRASEIPYLLTHYPDDPLGQFEATVTALHALGASSPAIALGVSQHLASMLAFGIARGLLSGSDHSSSIVEKLLADTHERRLLIANTTSHAGGSTIGSSGSYISRVEEGYRIDGYSTFMSLATEADKVVFLTQDSDRGLVGVVADLKGNPALSVSDELLFGQYLRLADTRRLSFNGLVVGSDTVIGPDQKLSLFYAIQLLCHNLCVASLYLGGAFRILEETRAFGQSTTLPDGRLLSASESFSANVGRMAIAYSTSLQLILESGKVIEEFRHGEMPDGTTAAERLLRVSASKFAVAQNIENIATEARKLIGARCFMGDHPVSRISAELLFAALGPATEKLIERNVGVRYLETKK